LLRKVLYVGTFAFILGNFQFLSEIVYRSFAGLGLTVSRNVLTGDDLLKPGRLAGVGFEAAWPLLKEAGDLVGVTGFFENFLTITVLLLAWLLVIAAFFLLAVQLFITILEFKLTALAGFVLVPFALWNKSAFLAERVLGNVIASGVKVMVLAVIVGIGAGFFQEFVDALKGQDATLNQAVTLVLASLALFGFGIFGPGIAAGLVSGAPQLGAGAAVGTAGAAVGTAMIAGGATLAAGRSSATLAQAGVTRLIAAPAQSAVATTAATSGQGTTTTPAASSRQQQPPTWAYAMQAEQRRRARIHGTAESLKAGDRSVGGANPDLGSD
jgi:type IV secretion system protein TrbL